MGQEKESFYSRSISLQEAVIVVNSLRKEYEDKKACSMFKKKKKVAVRNLSFSVKKGSNTLLPFSLSPLPMSIWCEGCIWRPYIY